MTKNRPLILVPWVILLLSLGATAVGTWMVSLKTHERARLRFEHLVEQLEVSLQERMTLYESVLRGGVSLFYASKEVTARQWRTYAMTVGVHDRFPGILGMGFIQNIPGEGLDSFLDVKQSEFPGFAIFPSSLPASEPDRKNWIISLVEPIETNLPALGFNVFADQSVRTAASLSRDTAAASVTEKVALQQDRSRAPGFLMLLPVYRKGFPIRTIEERREALEGWVFAPFLYQKLLQGLLEPQELKEVDFEVFDGTSPSRDSMIFDGDNQLQSLTEWSKGVRRPEFELKVLMSFYGRPWTVHALALPGFTQNLSRNQVLFIFLGGLLLSVLLFLLLRSIILTRNRALELARQMTEDLARTRDSAVQASQHKSQFLANMSHEIRTPINGVSGLTDLLLDTPLSQEQRTLAQGIKQSAKSLLALVNDVLDLSRIESGKVDPENISFELMPLIRDLEAPFRIQAKQKGLQYFSLFQSVPRAVKGDPSRISQILTNLLANAIKFTEKGSVTLKVELNSSLGAFAQIRFEVIDTGIGIAPEALEQLFKPFTQADSSTSRKYGGTGLGLSIAHNLAHVLGGSLTASSDLGHGSRFSLILPLEVVETVTSNPRSEPSAPGAPEKLGLRVLIAEDNVINQEVAVQTLKRFGCEVEVAQNGAEAVLAVERSPYDLILMDCQMPEMDGYTATQRIRTHTDPTVQTTPIIAMTAHATRGEKEKCLSIGMNDYLPKPFSREELFEVLKKWKHADTLRPNTDSRTKDSAPIQTTEPPVLDVRKLLDLKALDPETPKDISLLGRCLGVFTKETPERLEQMERDLKAGALKSLETLSHSLKSSSAMLGAMRFSSVCERIEVLSAQAGAEATVALSHELSQLRTCFSETLSALHETGF